MASVIKDNQAIGKNGVIIRQHPRRSDGSLKYRTYEIYQRERVGESTEKIKPGQLISESFRQDPYPTVAVLREHYPCYRDWLSNSYWISEYNDVTSIFTDDANFETRPKTWTYNLENSGRNLNEELPLLEAEETFTDTQAEKIATTIASRLAQKGHGNLATEFAAHFAMNLLLGSLDIPSFDAGRFTALFWRMQRGTSWNPSLRDDGKKALAELTHYLDPIVAKRKKQPGEDLISVMIQLAPSGEPVTVNDIVVTLLERDHETLHGTLANLWFLLLTHPEEQRQAISDRRLMKLAYLETLRHSTPVLSAHRYARHEVERFGRLIPEGAQLVCSAAAANRDPKIFNDPDSFIVDRKDMCQRESRGQYRADGLAAGIAFGLGKPSVHPAIPEDRPRSRYALTRDTAVTASEVLVSHLDNIRLAKGASPNLSALTVGEMHTCWKLPVTFSKK
jgi:pulcherriminic acid synthase